ncbi:hypothetical protein Tco_1224414 [Tanacetum coccineum]
MAFTTLLIELCVLLLLNKLNDLEVIVARHVIPSHHYSTSSHQHDDDDDDVKTSRGRTPSPTTYLNSLEPLNYQNYQMPSASEQTDETLFERQTILLNQTQEMHKEMLGGFKSFGKALNGVFSGNGYPRKGRKTKPKTIKPSTEWKNVKVKVKVNPD